MSSANLAGSVGSTALLAAYARAQETRRDEACFRDPWAESFVLANAGLSFGARLAALPAVGPARDDGSSPAWNRARAVIVGRTPFFDQQVTTAVDDGARQVVLLGAGMDARAARLSLQGCVVYEVDSQAVLTFKGEVLAQLGLDVERRVPVAGDLEGNWTRALLDAGFTADSPAVWVLEGLLMYQKADVCHQILDGVARLSAAGSRVAVEYVDTRPRAGDGESAAERHMSKGPVAEFISAGPQMTPDDLFAVHDMTLVEERSVADELRRIGRPVPDPLDTSKTGDAVVQWLAAATVDRA